MIGSWDSETKTFYKKVDDSKHFMEMFQGYGIDGEVLKALPDGSNINITNQDNKVYEATKEDYLNYNATKDFGHGVQYFLPRNKFPVRPITELPDPYKSAQTELAL